ncbi:ABC transporter ATP-binding protein [Spiribacter vilamensis]|nr:ABC transporter ATP-binding protein [Spiribacter vilamensis]
MVIVMALLETAGVASVMPFLSVLSNPGVVESNPLLRRLYAMLGVESVDTFLVVLGASVFCLLIFSALFRTVTHFAMNRFIEMRRHSVSARLLETYLRQPYAFFLDRHSGDMAKNILSEVDQLVARVFRPAMLLVAYSVVVVSIVALLVVVSPVLAGIVALAIGSMYGLIYVAVRTPLGKIGRERARANQERFEAAGEALGGIKDIKLLGRENAYLQRFLRPSITQARNQSTTQTLAEVPKFLIEAVAMGGIIALTLGLMAIHGGVEGDGLGQVLPVLGLYALAAYRMLPAANHIYGGAARMRFGEAALDSAYNDLRYRAELCEIRGRMPAPMRPRYEVALDRISFTYPNATQPALEEIALTIPVGSSVGLVGSTGAGKTTLVDVLLGLLRPTEGALRVDGEPVTESNLRAWQGALGYVPQDIFLTDSTVTENIALGVPPAQIDHEQVERCARMAQVHDFIIRDMPDQYETMVGERGVRLSGGQRQRIGIARALYHDPSVLVFDEATSALDSVTEKAVMRAINDLHHEKTIILIAHRLTTVEHCDQVVLLEHGAVVARGGFEALRASSEKFREMAGARV